MRPKLFLMLAVATTVALLAGDAATDPSVISTVGIGWPARPPAAAAAAPAINRVHVASLDTDTILASQDLSVTPTPTSTPGPREATEDVHLRGGVCTPVFTTYPNGTPIPTIAAAVSPPGMLQVLWDFERGTWLGYSPLFPEVGDLTEVDFLDIVFLCVGGSGPSAAIFTRPLVWASSR